MFFSTPTETSFAFNKNMPSSVIKEILIDYSTKAASVVANSKKESDLIIEVQEDQAFKFNVLNKKFEIIPFTYLPNQPESTRKCVVRILYMPDHRVLQDLEPSFNDNDELPCNGVIALSFKDVNSDKANEIIALYDFSTSGNKSMEPEVAVYTYNSVSKKFILNQALSFKAAGKRVRNMKDALKNLKR